MYMNSIIDIKEVKQSQYYLPIMPMVFIYNDSYPFRATSAVPFPFPDLDLATGPLS